MNRAFGDRFNRQNMFESQLASQSVMKTSRTDHLLLLRSSSLSAVLGWMVAMTSGLSSAAIAAPPTFTITVNSSQDGPVQADENLTLREALLLVNGRLTLDQLSADEQAQVTPNAEGNRIGFNLPSDQTTIRLLEALPVLEQPNTLLDGTTQPGYAIQPSINEVPLYAPIVAVTPADNQKILRGLVIAANNVTIRGLSLYGFTQTHTSTASTPPADIFISHRLPPPDISKQPTPANFSPFYADDLPAQNAVIEQNWLGVAPSAAAQARGSAGAAKPSSQDLQPVMPGGDRSAFGVVVFNGTRATLHQNWIANHDGSAILTSVNATQLQVTNNVITGNGLAGMPDAIRLEGDISQAKIASNIICANDGSGVYLFKPHGAAQITDNQIIFNGRRLRRAAVYLMGNNHQVTNNQIRYQTAAGVVVASYPNSSQNQIQANRFSNLEGLSIDLVAEHNTGVFDYQRGDGPNPQRNSEQRRRDTGNGAVNAPKFASRQFITTDGTAAVTGTADPGSQVEIYRAAAAQDGFGPLGEPIATAETDAQGKFSVQVQGLPELEEISAIATDPRYGTSEPARNAMLSVDPTVLRPASPVAPTSNPQCTTPYGETPPVVPPTAVLPPQVTVPGNIYFGLDQDAISAKSAQVLDQIVAVLQANPSITVTIVGHTDPRSSDAYNIALGLRRARNARNYLIQQGIAPARLTIRTQGEQQLVSQGTTRLDYARDRRAEFIYKDLSGIEVIVQDTDLQVEPAAPSRP
jgi:outer membrane protein OmpA-like peptidoglycan-associated protein